MTQKKMDTISAPLKSESSSNSNVRKRRALDNKSNEQEASRCVLSASDVKEKNLLIHEFYKKLRTRYPDIKAVSEEEVEAAVEKKLGHKLKPVYMNEEEEQKKAKKILEKNKEFLLKAPTKDI